MSIKSNYTIKESGLIISDAITKIMYFKGSYKQNYKYNIIISTCTYANTEAKEQGLKPIDENREFEFYVNTEDFETKSIIELCYNELKKLPEFSSAIDC